MNVLLRPAKMATISIMLPASASVKMSLAQATIFSIMKNEAYAQTNWLFWNAGADNTYFIQN